jgi:hypothetical protein
MEPVMKQLGDWLDGLVRRACEWLNGLLPAEHPLALAGATMAGLQTEVLLPVDRRVLPTISKMAGYYGGTTGTTHPAGAWGVTPFVLDPLADEAHCTFWAYCHISGVPCQFCKPHSVKTMNVLGAGTKDSPAVLAKARCPLMGKGLSGQFAWYGCCKDPKTGKGKYIGFADCCHPNPHYLQDCAGVDAAGHPDWSKWCEAWPLAKNWCYAGGSGHTLAYYCTFVFYQPDSDSNC